MRTRERGSKNLTILLTSYLEAPQKFLAETPQVLYFRTIFSSAENIFGRALVRVKAHSPIILDHCAGGLHSGYCLGNLSRSQKVLNVTLSNNDAEFLPLNLIDYSLIILEFNLLEMS